MRLLADVLLLLIILVMPVLAENEAPVLTDEDLEKYGGSGGSISSEPGEETSLRTEEEQGDRTFSPMESDLRRRKDDVVQENRDYIEDQHQWMIKDCQQFEGEMKKDCFFRSDAWRKEQLQQVDRLKHYLSK